MSDEKLREVFDSMGVDDGKKDPIVAKSLKAGEALIAHRKRKAKDAVAYKDNLKSLEREHEKKMKVHEENIREAEKQWMASKDDFFVYLNKCLLELKEGDGVVFRTTNDDSDWKLGSIKKIDFEVDESGSRDWRIIITDSKKTDHRMKFSNYDKQHERIVLVPRLATDSSLPAMKVLLQNFLGKLVPIVFD